MATKSKLKVKCQIDRIEDNPKGGANVFVTCTVGLRTWQKEFYVIYDRPISMEYFKKELAKDIMPKNDNDNLRFVKQEAAKPFTLDVNI